MFLVLAALKPAYDAVIAEPENVFFEVYQNPQKKGEFKFIENWNASVERLMTVSSNLTRALGRAEICLLMV
jgi:quinol monooxygenase YgiN